MYRYTYISYVFENIAITVVSMYGIYTDIFER